MSRSVWSVAWRRLALAAVAAAVVDSAGDTGAAVVLGRVVEDQATY